MDFYIKKGSTLPILKMELINDGRNDYDAFHNRLQVIVLVKNITSVINFLKKKLKKLGLTVENSQLYLMMVLVNLSFQLGKI